MKDKKIIKIYLYTRYERLWHWLQALMIISLIITGLEIHGTYKLFGFQTAVNIHNFVGLTWLILFAFFVFWLFTTGEWKQYIPTTKKTVFSNSVLFLGNFSRQTAPSAKGKRSQTQPFAEACLSWHFCNAIAGTNGHRSFILSL